MDNICWLAPEILAQDLSGYTNKSDMYSIGIAALELSTGEAPFAGLPVTEVSNSNFCIGPVVHVRISMNALAELKVEHMNNNFITRKCDNIGQGKVSSTY